MLGMACCMADVHAQHQDRGRAHDAFDDFRKEMRGDMDDFRKGMRRDMDDFRQKCMDEFIEFVRNPWKDFEEQAPVPKPKEDDVPPVVMPEEDKDKQREDRAVVIDEVIKPIPVAPQPQPLAPIEETPVPEPDVRYVNFAFYGTAAKVRYDKEKCVHVQGVTEGQVADALKCFAREDFDNMLVDCLSLRETMKLPDWAYLMMLKSLAEHIAGGNNNDAVMLMFWLYAQSGYKARLAADNSRLYMLYASRHYIYDLPYFEMSGVRYYGMENIPSMLRICEAGLPKEKSLSLYMPQTPELAMNGGGQRTITSERYAEMTGSVSVNKNLIDFCNSYPTSMLDGNPMTRWAMYANKPMDATVKNTLYPALRAHLDGKSQREAVERLLNWVQTGFEYEYDDKVWGHDRAFFAEESLYYPYCDCEDRSILFTRLVRDLLGLRCILVYYPGHLATAVEFADADVRGDVISLNGRRFVVCDPTYIGAPVGATMDNMDNSSAKVILLD